MPRAARIDAPGVLQHVIGRGIEKRPIFRDAANRDDFITRLANLAPDVSDLMARIYGDSAAHFL